MILKGLIEKTVAIVLLSVTLSLGAQDYVKNDAIEAFNKGATALNDDDPTAAIAAFEECVSICEEVGEEADEYKEQAEAQIPAAYYDVAMISYKAKDYATAIEELEKTEKIAVGYGNAKIEAKSKKALSKLYNAQGNKALKAKELDEALGLYDQAISKDAGFSKAYLGKTLVFKSKGDDAGLKKQADETIKVATAEGDTKVADKTVKIVKNYFYNKAVTAKKSTKYQEAITSLDEALAYDENFENALYLKAIAANEVKNFASAVSAAEKAVSVNQGGVEDKAKLYFELARAKQGLKANTEACDAYKKASFGAYTEPAKYQIEHVLKCQ